MKDTISRRRFVQSSTAALASAIAFPHLARRSRSIDTTLPIPPLLEGRREGGRWIYELAARRGSSEILPGSRAETWGYNGSMLGPVVRLRRGEEVSIEVANELADPTTCHWHGLHVPAAMDGGPHQIIEPGGRWRSSFRVMNEAATYWYHSHLEGRTGEQVYRGLAGLIIVDDPELERLGLPSRYGVDDVPLVIQDRLLDPNGQLVYRGLQDPQGMIGDRILVNGTSTPTFVAPAQLVRLRILNGSNARIYDLGFDDDRSFYQIATDGGLLPAPVRLRRLQLATGERAELLVDLSDDAGGSLRLMNLAAAGAGSLRGRGPGRGFQGQGGAQSFEILEIVVDGGIETVAGALPEELVAAPALDLSAIDVVRDFTLRVGGMGMRGMGMGMMGRGGTRGADDGFTINGREMDMGYINETVKLGAVEEWRIFNMSPMTHPFHIHDVQFLVRSRGGSPPPPHERGWKDTVQVRPMETVAVVARFDDFADPEAPYMYHCHILEHEDRGMMGQFVVVE